MQLDRDGTALAAFVIGTVLAGGNAVGIRVTNRELEPLWGAGLRFLLAACLLGAVMAAMRLTLPRGPALVGVLLYGMLLFGGAFSLSYYALVRIHAGLGQTLLALVPLATLLLAVLQRQERLRPAAVLGTLISVAGIGVISGADGGSVPALSVLALLGAVLCFAEATVLVRRFPPVHPVTANAVGMGFGAAILLALSAISSESIVRPERGATWLAIAYMVVLGSGPVFVLYLVVVRLWSASRAAYTFVLIPLVTVLLSAWIDDEPIGAELILGGPLVVAGVYVGALRPAAAVRR
ncbi:MAG: EamA family transporter [Gaiellaceae bacterium MAG52_C11]|nr:EamA family transporter [Candidatus Gaiellasilicea maunaloa]